MKTIEFVNKNGVKLNLPASATIGDLLKMGITFHSLAPLDAPPHPSPSVFHNVDQTNTPMCKCGTPCAWYGDVGGFSVGCEKCNAKKARQSRESRARCKTRKP